MGDHHLSLSLSLVLKLSIIFRNLIALCCVNVVIFLLQKRTENTWSNFRWVKWPMKNDFSFPAVHHGCWLPAGRGLRHRKLQVRRQEVQTGAFPLPDFPTSGLWDLWWTNRRILPVLGLNTLERLPMLKRQWSSLYSDRIKLTGISLNRISFELCTHPHFLAQMRAHSHTHTHFGGFWFWFRTPRRLVFFAWFFANI